jgi:membrane protein DedA with SNARE-associated domain/membrane-associated phospholipid phosphatase
MHLPRDRKGWLKAAAVIAAVIAVYLLYRRFFPEFDLQKLLADISASLGAWTYLLVAVFAFLETGAFVGLVAPGETVVVLAGAVAGQGETSVLLTIALAWLGAFCGDTASFFLGVKLGRSFIVRNGPRFGISAERFAQVEAYFHAHGGKTILIGRFIGLIRVLAPFIAGASGMRYRAMLPYSVLGTGLWATFFTLLGYFASQNLDEVVSVAERGFLYFALIVGLIVGLIVAVRFIRDPRNRRRLVAEMDQRSYLRPLLRFGRRLAPQARFLWERLTPGGLGLELTAPLAALAVGSFVFISYAVVVGDNPGPTGADTAATDLVAELRTDWLTSIEKIVTAFGSPAALVVVTTLAGAWFAIRGHRAELWILVAGAALMLIAVPELKDAFDRPRPTDAALVDAGGSSYPSGHAAYSVVYSWLAIALTLRLRPGWSGGTALLVAGLLVTAAIGLSRVYLGVHYLSDVLGGWGLGACAFAIATVVYVLVAHFRQNRARES